MHGENPFQCSSCRLKAPLEGTAASLQSIYCIPLTVFVACWQEMLQSALSQYPTFYLVTASGPTETKVSNPSQVREKGLMWLHLPGKKAVLLPREGNYLEAKCSFLYSQLSS